MECTGTSREWDHCRVEKMGCLGCYYYRKENEMNIDTAKNILEKEIANIGDEDLSEALYVILHDFVSKKSLASHVSKELHMIDKNKTLDKNTLNGMKSAYIAMKNIFLEEK